MQKEALSRKVGCADPLEPASAAIKTNWHEEFPRYLLVYGLGTSAHIKLQNAWDSESKITFLNEKHHVLKWWKNILQDLKHQPADKRNPESHWAWGDFCTLKWTFVATASTHLRTWYKSQGINNNNSIPSNIFFFLQDTGKKEHGVCGRSLEHEFCLCHAY